MKKLVVLLGCFWVQAIFAGGGYEVDGGRTIQAPVVHENLAVFMITGKDLYEGAANYVTLEEAMKKEWVMVHETGNVNQLAVENPKLKEEVAGYKKAFAGLVDKFPHAVGYAVTINGEFSTADVYASRELFRKMWVQHLEGAITEAVSLKHEAKPDQKVDLAWRDAMFKDDGFEEKLKHKTGGLNDYTGEQSAQFFRYNCVLPEANGQKVALRMSYEKREEGETLNPAPQNSSRGQLRNAPLQQGQQRLQLRELNLNLNDLQQNGEGSSLRRNPQGQ